MEQRRGPGRPKKKEIAYDPEAIKDFVKRYFELEKEVLVLREDKKELKENFKDKINHKLLGKVIRLVKDKIALEQEEVSESTVEDIEDIVRDKVNMVVG
jgi:SpoVK/Ycf46/Vps4 family AAA+-type ATPase